MFEAPKFKDGTPSGTVTKSEEFILKAWTRVGVGFNLEPNDFPTDLAELLVRSVPIFSRNSRLFFLVATWLQANSHLVDAERLAACARRELQGDNLSTLGLLLDCALPGNQRAHFAGLLAQIPPAEKAQPFFEVMRNDARLRDLSERHSSPIGKRWNLWLEEFPFKFDALRPRSWILAHNPDLKPPLKGP